MNQLLKQIKGKDVIIFGTSPHINDILLTPNGINIKQNTKYTKSEGLRFNNISVELSEEKKQELNNVYCKSNLDKFFTIGLNLFSCYFPTDVAFWVDPTVWLSNEIVNKSLAKTLMTTNEIFNRNNQDKRINKVFKLAIERESAHLGIIDKEYKGYIWQYKTVAFGAIHLAAMAGAKRIYLAGVEVDPLVSNHFYEDENVKLYVPWVPPVALDIVSKFPEIFPDIEFYNTNKMSYVPFDRYKPFNEVINV